MLNFEFGISSKVLRDYTLKEAISIAEKCGYDVMEIWIDDLIMSGLSTNEVISLTDYYGLKRSVHLRTDDLNIASFNDGIRVESVKQAKEGILLASQIKASEVTLHPGRKTSKTNSLEEAWILQLRSVRELAHTAENCSITLCIEGMERINGEFVLTINDLKYVLEQCQSEALGITIDISHLHTVGDACMFLKEAEKLPVRNVHISQSSQEAYHLPVFDSKGEIDYVKAFEILSGYYRGSVIVEGYVPEMGRELARESIRWYKNITGSK